jgi:hypothetical protein
VRLFLAALTILFGLSAHADLDYKALQSSVYKVYKMTTDGKPYMVASAFAVTYDDGKNYMITNNHVCFGLAGPGKSYVKVIDGSSDKYTGGDYDQITDVSTTAESDICVIKTKSYHPGLILSRTSAKIFDTVTVFGYIGRSDYSMPTHGYMYGYDRVTDYAGFKSCRDYPPHAFRNKILCWFYDRYPMMTSSNVLVANVNIGPGYSGSPVFNDGGEVAGIVARYIPPSDIYGNGDGIFYDVNVIRRAIDTAHMEPVDNPDLYYRSIILDYANKMMDWKETLNNLLDN